MADIAIEIEVLDYFRPKIISFIEKIEMLEFMAGPLYVRSYWE